MGRRDLSSVGSQVRPILTVAFVFAAFFLPALALEGWNFLRSEWDHLRFRFAGERDQFLRADWTSGETVTLSARLLNLRKRIP